METECVPCEVGTEFFNMIKMSVVFKSVNLHSDVILWVLRSMNWDSSVNAVTRLRADDRKIRIEFPAGGEIFIFTTAFTPTLGPASLLPDVHFPRDKTTGA
jgi:hypothetical protein